MPPSAASRARRGFTLVELMIVTVAMSILLVTAFEILGNVGFLSTRISGQVDANKDVYYAMEKLATYVKEGGKLDFEEYWARSAFTSSGYALMGGHYPAVTGFGNFGSGGVFGSGVFGDQPYLCRSLPKNYDLAGASALVMGSGGCLGDAASGALLSTAGDSHDKPQRYGQYRQQFVDYNSDAGSETATAVGLPASAWGDENNDGSIAGDDDDADLGVGPAAFPAFATGARELYLVKRFPQQERTFFRYVARRDTYLSGSQWSCDLSTGSGNACIGNVQMLKLVGKDLGYDHTGTGAGANDGKADTWVCATGFHCFQQIMGGKYEIPTGSDAEWVDLFPDYVNVRKLEFYPWPNKDGRYAWREPDPSLTIAPYVRIRITVGQSGQQRLLSKKTTDPQTSYSTTVSLSDF